jgi:hypothetical protein
MKIQGLQQGCSQAHGSLLSVQEASLASTLIEGLMYTRIMAVAGLTAGCTKVIADWRQTGLPGGQGATLTV